MVLIVICDRIIYKFVKTCVMGNTGIDIQKASSSKNRNWPVHPRWLSIRSGMKESEVMPNNDGLYMQDTIRGFIAASSDHPDIENTLSLFQVIPEDFPFDNPYGRIEPVDTKSEYISDILGKRIIIRIDPGRLYKNIGCCDIFRECENGECKFKCFDLDSRIALFYHPRLEKLHYFRHNSVYISEFERIKDEFNSTLKVDENGQIDEPINIYTYQVIDGKNKQKYTRLYVGYKCKYSGLYEYFFPIYHSGKVIAVLMQGQRNNPELVNYPMFAPYLDDSQKGEALKMSLQNLRCNEKFWLEPSLDDRRRDAIFDRIIEFARRINDTVNSISQQYVSREFQSIENEFRENINRIKRSDIQIVDEYKKILESTLKKIFYTFNDDGFIRIYSLIENNQEEKTTVSEFELIGDSNSQSNCSEYALLKFNELPVNRNVIEEKELISYLDDSQRDLILEDKHTFRLEIPFVHKMAHIIWKSYKLEKKNGVYQFQRDYYGNTLKLFYHVLLEPYIILKQLAFEELLEKSIRVSVHETAQVIPPIIQTLKSYFDYDKESIKTIGSNEFYKKFHEDFLRQIQNERYFREMIKKIGDINNRIELLDGLYKRSTLIFKSVDPTLDWEDFHRIIYSIQSLFDEKAFLNNRQSIEIHLEQVFSQYHIFTDKNFITQILFNLVDNAIKYGIRGSKINIRVRMPQITKEYLKHGIVQDEHMQIIVESFGQKIEDKSKNKLFDLYYRSSKDEIEGLGIGLFLVKRLCHILGYSVFCYSSEFVEAIHLPIYYFFCEQKGLVYLSEILEDRYTDIRVKNKIVLNNAIERVVNTDKQRNIDWDITDYEIENQLFDPVYSNKFVIYIPINKSNTKLIDHDAN